MKSERKINWAIVGLGDIVRKRVGPALTAQPQSTIRTCVTRDPSARASDLAALRPACVCTDIREALADPEIDAVYIATPVFLHAEQAIAALRAGKHVLVEKPMALGPREGELMIEVANESGRRLAVAYFRRFWPTFQRVKEILESGQLGQIVLIRLILHSWYAPSADDPKAWRARPEAAGGGVLYDVGCHRLDLLAWWFGLPHRVVAALSNRIHELAVEDSAAALMMFDEGIPCTVSFQWNSKSWTDELHIVGTDASVTCTPVDGDELVIHRGRETMRSAHKRPDNAHYPLVDDFACAILANRAPRFDANDGFAATRMMDWMMQSSTDNTWMETG